MAHEIRLDPVLRLFLEYVSIGNPMEYDGLLRHMLSDQERQLLETDADFTRAWNTFIELRWQSRRSIRKVVLLIIWVVVLVVATLVVGGFIAFIYWITGSASPIHWIIRSSGR